MTRAEAERQIRIKANKIDALQKLSHGDVRHRVAELRREIEKLTRLLALSPE